MVFVHYVDFWPLWGHPWKSRGCQKRSKKFNTATFRLPEAAPGTQKVVLEGVFKTASIFEWIWDAFWLQIRWISQWCFMFFRCWFEIVFLWFVHCFSNWFLNCTNLKIIENSLVLIHYFALGTFRRRWIFEAISDKCWDCFRIDFSLVFMFFRLRN